jgi:signal transduction histidine kinase/CheY-like chemotaxis protein/HPt (histidine-containing phosphotransfer) domain-containing protein
VTKASPGRIIEDFNLIVERNDLDSIGLRRESGQLYAATSNHAKLWEPMTGEYSKESQLRVPIWAGEKKWGQLELKFPAASGGLIGDVLDHPLVQLVIFTGGLCFVIFYFYLGRVLRHLDPSQAIPERVRAALDTMAEGLMILDRKEQIVLANKAFAEILNREPAQLMGVKASELPWVDMQAAEINPKDRPWVQALATGQILRDTMLKLRTLGKEYLTFKINCSPVLGDGNRYAGVLVSLDDVTLLEKKEVELRKSKEKAEAANVTKSAFLANMSHEIRTPMNAILGFTDLLKRGYVKNEAESLKYLNTIHSSGKGLLDLINDILDLSKVESGRLEVEKLSVPPYRIVHEVVQMLGNSAREKGIDLHLTAANALPETIATDPARLRQMAFNLVGNAIKFTDTGGVKVSCRYVDNGQRPQLEIAVTDTGIGMDHDTLETIFDPFVQADASVTRRFGGTGLGLSISRKFARALGGDITVESMPGKGSTFCIALPTGDLDGVAFLLPEEMERLLEIVESRKESRYRFAEADVLVVDDGKENRELVKIILEDAGVRVQEAENGREGLQKVAEGDFDIILMDVRMPVMDGFMAARAMRDQGVDVPIIALTAHAMKGFEQECLAKGYTGYLTKPIDIDAFMHLMAKYLDGKRDEREDTAQLPVDSSWLKTASQEEMAPDRESKHQPAVVKPVISRLAAHAKLKVVIEKFVEKLEGEIEIMRAACSQDNLEKLADLAHWLKGSAGTVGYDDFTEPAKELEAAANSGDKAQAKAWLSKIVDLQGAIVRPENTQTANDPAPRTSSETPQASTTPVLANSPGLALSQQPVISRLADHPRLKRAVNMFVDKLDGEVIKMEAAYTHQKLDDLANLAHWLKGAAGTVGYDAFTEPAEKLEKFAKEGDAVQAAATLQKIRGMAKAIVPPA